MLTGKVVSKMVHLKSPSLLSRLFIFLVLGVLQGTQAEVVPIKSRLTLKLSRGDEYTFLQGKHDTSLLDPIYGLVLFDAKEICVVGIWRFYPETNYMKNPTTEFSGYTLGKNEAEHCFEAHAELPWRLKDMKSFRPLGPEDLNQFSVTIYKGEDFTDTQISFTNLAYGAVINFPFDVKSWVLTGKTDPDSTSPLSLEPVLRIHTAIDGSDRKMPNVCYIMNGTDSTTGNVAKFYARKQMGLVSVEDVLIHWGSARFLDNIQVDSIVGLCYLEQNEDLTPRRIPYQQ